MKNRGFTLVEILVAAGMLAGLSLVYMKMSDNQMASTKQFEQRTEVVETMKEINGILSNQTLCSEILIGKDAMGQSNVTDKLKNSNGLDVFVKGQRLAGGIVINDYSLAQDYESNAILTMGEPKGQTSLRITFELNNPNQSKRELTRIVKLDVTVDSENSVAANKTKILTCKKAYGDIGEFATVDYVNETLAASLGRKCVEIHEASCPTGWNRIGTPKYAQSVVYDCTCYYGGAPSCSKLHKVVSVDFSCPSTANCGAMFNSTQFDYKTCTESTNVTFSGSICCAD